MLRTMLSRRSSTWKRTRSRRKCSRSVASGFKKLRPRKEESPPKMSKLSMNVSLKMKMTKMARVATEMTKTAQPRAKAKRKSLRKARAKRRLVEMMATTINKSLKSVLAKSFKNTMNFTKTTTTSGQIRTSLTTTNSTMTEPWLTPKCYLLSRTSLRRESMTC